MDFAVANFKGIAVFQPVINGKCTYKQAKNALTFLKSKVNHMLQMHSEDTRTIGIMDCAMD